MNSHTPSENHASAFWLGGGGPHGPEAHMAAQTSSQLQSAQVPTQLRAFVPRA